MVSRRICVLYDEDRDWWGIGPTVDEARRHALAGLEATMRQQYGEPPWQTATHRDTPETLARWVDGLVSVWVTVEAEAEAEVELALAALYSPRVATEVLEELARWRSREDPPPPSEVRRSL